MNNKFEEISYAISILTKNGLNINLPDQLKNQIEPNILFDGSDALFKTLASESNVYFEYGCGKSTLWMLNNTEAKVYSVDTSKDWIKSVEKEVSGTKENLEIKWVDLGELGEWGRPLTYKKIDQFQIYTNTLWEIGQEADLVLVDGRFRVCCFLTTLKYAKEGTKILFDDYKDRKYYHIVEEFVANEDTCGRQTLFIRPPQKEINQKRLEQMITYFRCVID